MKKILTIFNKKKVYSCASGSIVNFTDNLDDKLSEGAWSDGMTLIDNDPENGCEDDISQMYAVLKDGKSVNLQDFYEENGAYQNDDTFIENVENLIADR